MKYLDITVLFIDTIPARIYLALLKKHGYCPKKIILLDIVPSSSKYLLIRRFFGKTVASKLLALYGMFKLISSKSKKINTELSKSFLAEFGLTLSDVFFDLKTYPVGEIEKKTVNGINDPIFKAHLSNEKQKVFLFTGGGILNESFLSINDSRFLHIHPGIVPNIKGADCFFWSYLLRGKLGYSVFYMNPGIDTGDIIHQKEFDFSCSKKQLDNYSNDEVYTTILQFYDSALRIMTFIDMLDRKFKEAQELDLRQICYEKQDPEEGRTYFFMQKYLLNFVINQMKK